MDFPYRFPPESDKIYREALAYRRLSPTERFLQILGLMACGLTMLEQSPHREAARRLRDDQKADWQRIHKEFFARYGH